MAALTRILAAIALMVVAPGAAQAAGANLEYAVKANFLYKFAPFVSWPPQSLAAAAPFRICVAGTDPFGTALDAAVRGQRVNGRAIVVTRLQRAAGAGNCQILFVGASTGAAPDMLRAVAGQPVLTVTDERQNVSGGMIHFVLRSGRVRFTIDRGAASASGLDVSSKLLDLAVPANG